MKISFSNQKNNCHFTSDLILSENLNYLRSVNELPDEVLELRSQMAYDKENYQVLIESNDKPKYLNFDLVRDFIYNGDFRKRALGIRSIPFLPKSSQRDVLIDKAMFDSYLNNQKLSVNLIPIVNDSNVAKDAISIKFRQSSEVQRDFAYQAGAIPDAEAASKFILKSLDKFLVSDFTAELVSGSSNIKNDGVKRALLEKIFKDYSQNKSVLFGLCSAFGKINDSREFRYFASKLLNINLTDEHKRSFAIATGSTHFSNENLINFVRDYNDDVVNKELGNELAKQKIISDLLKKVKIPENHFLVKISEGQIALKEMFVQRDNLIDTVLYATRRIGQKAVKSL